MKKELSKIDYAFIGLVIGVIMMGIVMLLYIANEQQTCKHRYTTRCTECGDILSDEEAAALYCNH